MRVFSYLGFTMLVGMTVAQFAGITISVSVAVLSILAIGFLLILSKKKKNVKLILILSTVSFALLLQSLISTTSFNIYSYDSKPIQFEGKVLSSNVSMHDTNYYLVKTTKINNTPASYEMYLFGNSSSFDTNDIVSGEGVVDIHNYNSTRTIISANLNGQLRKIGEHKTLLSHIDNIRKTVFDNARLYIKSTETPLFVGMVFGDTSMISNSLRTTFSRCGIAHIFSVSGLHLSIISGLIAFLCIHFGLSARKRSIITIIILAFMVLFVGLSQSVLRSFFMLVIYNLSKFTSRRSDSLNSLGFAVFTLLVLDSTSITDVSFLLTITATLGIIVISPRLTRFNSKKWPAILQITAQTGIISFSAFIGTLPVTAVYFDEISLIGCFINIIFAPLFSIMLILCLLLCLTCCFSFLSILSNLLGSLCSILFELMEIVCSFISKIPFTFLPKDFNLYLFYCIILLAFLPLLCYYRRKILQIRDILRSKK